MTSTGFAVSDGAVTTVLLPGPSLPNPVTVAGRTIRYAGMDTYTCCKAMTPLARSAARSSSRARIATDAAK